ncbi:MAG: fibrobacter succinogenes major paralogous domain-containing protein, partial [Dysgonamonadaceae bacterium]|nr:fibrobacter succinogenes major paralogous domain-containing protein [Dysgonamonadaceae bacterium]
DYADAADWTAKTWQDDSNNWIAAKDPCPAGWRLPTGAECAAILYNNTIFTYIGATNTGSHVVSLGFDNAVSPACCYNHSFKIGDYLYFPVTGYRRPSDGALVDRGGIGYYINSDAGKPDTSRAMSMYLGSNTDGVEGYFYRTNGFSVRCVSAD